MFAISKLDGSNLQFGQTTRTFFAIYSYLNISDEIIKLSRDTEGNLIVSRLLEEKRNVKIGKTIRSETAIRSETTMRGEKTIRSKKTIESKKNHLEVKRPFEVREYVYEIRGPRFVCKDDLVDDSRLVFHFTLLV
uniref:Uncharacterized protein n=1 Tax=Tanacetum cinerariifolium TaxID=118510 RepID=A0A699V0E5_TANCI|nr:hypothetical protein [Tanacetum cinerariifolium]